MQQVAALLKGKLHSGVMIAYGISGAGKTYTIEGPRADPGVLPQALAQVFEVLPRSSCQANDALRTGLNKYATCRRFADALTPLEIIGAHGRFCCRRPSRYLMV